MATLESLLPYVHDELPAVPRPVALRALSDAARRFCQRSTGWRADLPPVGVVAGTSTYTPTLPPGSRIVAGHRARLYGKKIDIVTGERLRELEDAYVAATRPIALTILPGAVVRFVPAPQETAADALELWVSLQPPLGGTDIPDFILDEYGGALAAGAKGILRRMPDAPWANPTDAALKERELRVAASELRWATDTAYGGASVRTVIPPWV